MATLYLKAAGGNWTDAGTWSTTGSGGADSSGPPLSTDDCIAEAGSGNLTISATSVGKSFSATAGAGNWTGTLTQNAVTWTISGNITFSSGMTFAPNATSTISIGANSTFITAGIPLRALSISTATLTLGDNMTFTSSVKTAQISMATSGALNLNGFTISGNSASSRVLLLSSVMGTSRTVTVAGGTFANADFRDIQFSNATDLDLSAITGGSGDCGGNTITGGGTVLTFTSPATQTYTGGAGNWSTAGSWTSRVPLPQDNVSMSGCTGGSIVADMPRLGKDIDWTGATGTPTWTINSIATEVYGSVTLISGMTLTHTSVTFVLAGRGNHTITSAGKTWASSSAGAFAVQAFGGTYTIQDAFIKGAGTGALTLSNGTFDMNNFNVTAAGSQGFTSTSTSARTLTMRSGTFTLSGSSGTLWNIASASLTINAGTSTIAITDTGASSKTFITGGKTYYNLLISGGGAGAVIINTGAATFNRIYTDGAGTKSITIPGSSTTTLLSGQGLNNGTNVITFTPSTASATLSKASGTVAWDYVNLTNIPSTGGATFYAGSHSTDGGGNTGWIFTAPPAITRTNSGRVAPNSISIGIGI